MMIRALNPWVWKVFPRSVAKILAPKTGAARKFTVSWTTADGSIRSVEIRSRTYPTGDDFPPGHPIFSCGYADAFLDNYDEVEITTITVSQNALTGWEGEHPWIVFCILSCLTMS